MIKTKDSDLTFFEALSKNRIESLSKLNIDKNQISGLEALLWPPKIKKTLNTYSKHSAAIEKFDNDKKRRDALHTYFAAEVCSKQPEVARKIDYAMNTISSYAKVMTSNSTPAENPFKSKENELLYLFEKNSFERRKYSFPEFLNKIIEFYEEYDSLINLAKKTPSAAGLRAFLKQIAPYVTKDRAWLVEGGKQKVECLREATVSSLLELKIQRSEKLSEVNPDLAEIYLFSNPAFIKKTGERYRHLIPAQLNYSFPKLNNIPFWKIDTEVYLGIIEFLKEKYRENIIHTPKTKISSSFEDAGEKKIPSVYDALKTSILQNKLISPVPGIETRIDYFVNEDIKLKTKLSDEKIIELRKSFAAFNLTRKLRKTEDRDEKKIINFFDDVFLRIYSNKNIPTSKELDIMYQNS